MNYARVLLVAISAAALTALSMPLVLSLVKRKKAGQPILVYVEQHKNKSGTPTMGGLGFVLPLSITTLLLCERGFSSGRMAAIATLAYASLGFLDDALKIKRKENGGLRPWQKILGQGAVALLLGWYAKRAGITSFYLPFSSYSLDIGYWTIPFVAFVFIATSNAVNLTDGLDALAGTTSAVYFVCFSIAIATTLVSVSDADLVYFGVATTFSLLVFLVYNASPAKIFMGDTGSLSLGGAAAAIGVFSRNPLGIVLAGITFVWSCISVIVQVAVFKIKGKRVFKMAPFHHHLEKSGWSEPRIVALYSAITAIMGVLMIYSIAAWR